RAVVRNLDAVTSALKAFPADGYTARWQTWDGDGDETLTLRWENEGWTAVGEVGRERVSYVIRLTSTWQTSQFLLFRDLDEPDLWLGTDGRGRWGEVNGVHRPDLDGCEDVDVNCTPFTNTLPIRRLDLEVGDYAEITAARIDVEILGVVPTTQRYERVAPQRWSYRNVDSGFETEFAVDEYGLVLDYPDTFRRV
ncbi:MAG: putative glycolipid-binding domain-containing protein, partial [Actinomycetota bacterium]